jgi:hypothetical protein
MCDIFIYDYQPAELPRDCIQTSTGYIIRSRNSGDLQQDPPVLLISRQKQKEERMCVLQGFQFKQYTY